MTPLEAIWLIPLFPLAGALMMLLAGKRLEIAGARRTIAILCPGMVFLSFLLSAWATSSLAGLTKRAHEVVLFTWLPGLPFRMGDGTLGNFSADFGFLLDPLSAVMILVVTGIGFLIHLYSAAYMEHDGGYYRFFGYLNLFVFFMLVLVLANNYLLLFAGWEGVGLCSYLLIGFYFDRQSAADAGKKAFLVNRVGDAAFLLGMMYLFHLFGSVRFLSVNEALGAGRFGAESAGFGTLSIAALLLFIGAMGKSAQFPLHIWLPDAMEGPTPVSALIHAATMVTAGVYMVVRSHALYALTPHVSEIVLYLGAFTAIFAATIALVQTDIKRVLAYSTVSQLGYMFMAAGAGAYAAAIFHLFTHAFFKALLFLGAGSVIHGLGGEQDMRRMGGLRAHMPATYWTMFAGSLAIAGIPGLAGFFSKDEILWKVYSAPDGAKAVYAIGLITAALTAFYMWRLMFMTFFGEARNTAHAHESPRVMTLPLMVLAAGSVLAGWIAGPFEHWLGIVEPESHGDHTTELLLMGLSVAVAVGGILFARSLYGKTWVSDPIESLTGPLHRALVNKWYIDEIVNFLFVDGLGKSGGSGLARIDRNVVDGGVNGAGWLTRSVSRLSMWSDRWIIDGAVWLSATGALFAGFITRLFQTGRVQAYAFVFLAAVAVLLGWRWF